MMGYWMNFCSNLECGVYVSSSFCFLGTHEVLSGVEKNILYKTWPLLMNIAPRICLAQSSCSSFIGIMNNLLSTIFHCEENTSKLTLHRSTLRKIGKRFCNRVGLVSEFKMGSCKHLHTLRKWGECDGFQFEASPEESLSVCCT